MRRDRDHDSLREGVKYRYLALSGSRLVKSSQSLIYLLLGGLRRYISALDADILIKAEDLRRDLLQEAYSGPARVEVIPHGELSRLPMGKPFNDITFDTQPSKAQDGIVLENKRVHVGYVSFNPSVVHSSWDTFIVTNRNESIFAPRSVIELYNSSHFPPPTNKRPSKTDLGKNHVGFLGTLR